MNNNKIAIYARFSTLEQLGITDKSLSVRYFKFIQKYEDYVSKYCNVSLSNKKKEELGKVGMKFYNLIVKMANEDYYPWRTLPKGAEIICLNEIFETDPDETLKYLKVEDLLNDDFFILAEQELTNYYKSNNIDKTEDEIFDEITNFKFDRKFKREVFSKATREAHNLCVELEPICKDLFEKYKILNEKSNSQKEEKDITDDLF